MARYRTDVTTPAGPRAAFAFMADFTNAADWDPGIRRATRVDTGPLRVGSAFDVTAEYAGREITLRYEVEELVEPDRVVLRGETSTFTSIDTITVRGAGDGAVVTYDADVRMRGPLKLLDPLVHLGFQRVGDKAAAGLREHLRSLPDRDPATGAGGGR